jgi:predicted porin
MAIAVMGACAGTAYADDSTLTLYGILDAGIFTLDHSANFNGGGFVTAVPAYGTGSNLGATSRATGIMNGGESATRWGIRGSEDMGDGMKAFFQLESGINLANGTLATSALAQSNLRTGVSGAADTSLNGQLFGRGAFAGLSNSTWGSLAVGRVTSLQLDMIGRYDPVNAQMFSPINFSGTYGGGGVTDNARVDNALKYTGKWDAFNLGLIHKFGGIAGASSAQQVNEINAGWEQGPFGVQVAYTMANDTTKIDNNGFTPAGGVLTPYPAGTVGVTWLDTHSWMVAAKWQATPPLKLLIGYEREQYMNPSNPAADIAQTGIYSYTIYTTCTVAGGATLASSCVNPYTGTPDQVLNVWWAGANYDFTGAWKGSIGYYHVGQNDYSAGSVAVKNMGKLSGTDEYTSAMLEYKFSKRTNMYGAILYNKKAGGVANANNGTTLGLSTGVTTYTGIGLGIRHVF